MRKNILYAAFIVSLLATVGSLFMSEFLGWVPCVLCWYQRIMLYPLVIIFAAAILKDVSNLEYIVFPLVIIGMLIAFYHTLLQYGIIPTNLVRCVAGASCVTPYNIGFSFLTVPLMSFLTFGAILGLMFAYRKEIK